MEEGKEENEENNDVNCNEYNIALVISFANIFICKILLIVFSITKLY